MLLFMLFLIVFLRVLHFFFAEGLAKAPEPHLFIHRMIKYIMIFHKGVMCTMRNNIKRQLSLVSNKTCFSRKSAKWFWICTNKQFWKVSLNFLLSSNSWKNRHSKFQSEFTNLIISRQSDFTIRFCRPFLASNLW